MKQTLHRLIFVLACAIATQAMAQQRNLSCKLHFSSKEWSALYQSATGSGTVSCSNGASMPVDIRARGVGLSAGRWKITEGNGQFTRVSTIEDVLGNYLAISGQVGLYKAGTAQVLARRRVALALAGKGEGFDLGVAISDFTISKAAQADTTGEK